MINVRIYDFIGVNGIASVDTLCEHFNLEEETVLGYLKELLESGVIVKEKELYRKRKFEEYTHRGEPEGKSIKLTFKFKKQKKGYTASCKQLKGAISQGESLKDALFNILEAAQGYILAFGLDDLKIK
jgi:predicted RNase H-like HicB family nuclease